MQTLSISVNPYEPRVIICTPLLGLFETRLQSAHVRMIELLHWFVCLLLEKSLVAQLWLVGIRTPLGSHICIET